MQKHTIEEIRNLKEDVAECMTGGVLSEIRDCVTKHDKPYIAGMIKDGEFEIPYKVWDTTKAQFVAKYGLSDASLRAGEYLGQVQLYEGAPQMIISKIKFIGNEEGRKYLNYFPGIDDAKAHVRGFVDELVKWDEEIGGITKAFYDAFEKTGKLNYYPYSPSVGPHSELGGFVGHVYLSLIRSEGSRFTLAKDKELVDMNVVYAGILLHHIGIFSSVKMDATGAILDDGERSKILYGGIDAETLLLIFNKFKKSGALTKKEEHVLHLLAAFAGITEPATPEASIFVSVVNSELSQFEKIAETKNLAEGESLRNTFGRRTLRL